MNLNKRILVIEDDVATREIFRLFLQEKGYDVFDAADGEEGIQFLSQNPVDVVVTDINMPRKNGFEVIQEITNHYPEIFIIAISGTLVQSGVDYRQKALQLGAHIMLKKPFALDKLCELVENFKSPSPEVEPK